MRLGTLCVEATPINSHAPGMHFLGCALELLGGCVHAREPMPIYCIHRIVMFDFPSINLYGVRRETTLITGPAPPKYLSLDGSLRVCVCICDPFVFLAWRIVPLVYTSLHDSPEVSTCLYIISNLRTVNSLCHSCLPFCGQTPRHIMFSIYLPGDPVRHGGPQVHLLLLLVHHYRYHTHHPCLGME